jgi:hypothetical protein
MGTFTLNGDINELTGEDATRVTIVRIRASHQIGQGGVAFPLETNVPAVGGVFTVDLPSDAEPAGYEFHVIAPQIGTTWRVTPGGTDTEIDLGYYVPPAPAEPEYTYP